MTRLLTSALLLVALSSNLSSAQDTPSCGPDNKCPESSPCCSQYGQCGVGAYCLGGCDPLSSFSFDACAPQPICQDRTITFENMDRLVPNTKYLGDASKADFVYSGEPVIYQNQVLLTMPENSVGTLLASTTYMWYGKTSAKLTTSGGQGVVTAFILLGDTKDEIDFEFVGYDLAQAQTNYYFQGILDYRNGGNSSVPGGNSMSTQHTYEIDWQPTSITWSIDGTEVRKLDRATTWNSTANRYDFPQTPSRVQLSLWPAGASNNPEGTIQWSGGPINWNSPYMSNNYYYAAFEQVTMECYDPPSGAAKTGSGDGTSYIITSQEGTNQSVEITDKNTIMSSLLATGLNMTAGETEDSSPSSSPSAIANVPGQGSSGSGANGNRGDSSDSSSSSSGSGSGSGTNSAPGSANSGFVQGGGAGGSSGAASSFMTMTTTNERIILRGSILAVVFLVGGIFVL